MNLVNLAMCKSWPICAQLPKKDVCFNQTVLVFALLSALINFGWHNCNIHLILSILGEQFNHHGLVEKVFSMERTFLFQRFPITFFVL